MTVRYRSTITVRVPAAKFDAFRKEVDRVIPYEYKWRTVDAIYVSVIRDSIGQGGRVIVDSHGDEGESEAACDGAHEAAIRGLIKINQADLTSEMQVEVIE
ncbi:hypothetical protein [Cryobacterium sp. PH31-O1]|uniref:hypothetical protein n=1 Tax=Cryobacterium sp. PH31-O1 TaxID=3046306 RepID=UPI0024BBAABA|nr:hypothetical protein [Cryobacterium sp. PH31-O1]MDJ0337445.1 hypothetical protein [Cryobacterium sp. PH31-O1]